MPLPAPNTRWLPPTWAPAFDRYRLNEAIWLNDTETLQALLTGGNTATEEGRTVAEQRKRKGVLVNLMRRWGWARIVPYGEKRTDLPIPIGASIADLSAAQLMSEPPMFRVIKRDQATGRAKTDKGPTQERLDRIATSDDSRMTLIEGAQIAAAISGTVLKATWDTLDPDRESVWYDAVGADCAIPEYNTAGRLVAVTLWQEYPDTGSRVLRHFERHAVGRIEHAVYRGTAVNVGSPVRIDMVPELADLMAQQGVQWEGLTAVMPTGIARLTAAFWRNRPARGWRRSGQLANLGRSDFELIEPALDAYSEAWGSMMRDVRLGKARAFVPPGTLDRLGGAGAGATFDPDREFYQEVGGLNPDAGAEVIKVEQPSIRWEEHLGVLAGLKMEILDGAGWSLSSYGAPAGGGAQGGAVTATEVVDRTTKSERTRDEKALLFSQAANPFFRMLLELDAALYPSGGPANVGELAIDFPDVSQVDPEKQARTFLDLSSAHAISIEQTIRERRPNWDDDEVEAELKRILEDMDRAAPPAADPTKLGLADPAGTEPPPGEDEPDDDETAA